MQFLLQNGKVHLLDMDLVRKTPMCQNLPVNDEKWTGFRAAKNFRLNSEKRIVGLS